MQKRTTEHLACMTAASAIFCHQHHWVQHAYWHRYIQHDALGLHDQHCQHKFTCDAYLDCIASVALDEVEAPAGEPDVLLEPLQPLYEVLSQPLLCNTNIAGHTRRLIPANSILTGNA